MLQSFVIYGGLILFMVFVNSKYTYLHKKGIHDNTSFWQLEIILTIFVFVLVSGVRYDVGVDYLTYLKGINYIQNHPYIASYETYEPGFIWTLKLFSFFDAHPTVVFGFFALLQISFIYYAFKREKFLYPFLAFIIMTAGFYFTMMNEIRQSIVWCAFILAVQYASKKDILKYAFLILLGLIYHSSTIMLIPLYFLINTDKDFFKSIKKQLILLFSVMILAEVNFWNAIMDQVTFLINIFNYGDKYGDLSSRMDIWQRSYSKGVRYYGTFLTYFFIIIYSKKLKETFNTKLFIKYYNLFFIGALLFFITYNNVLMQRPARYFMCMQLVISAYFLHFLWVKIDKKIVDLVILLLFVLLHLGILLAFIESDHHTNFIFYWNR